MARRVQSKSVLDVPIISTIGKPIPTKELIARLLKIADALSAVDQEQAVPEDYRNLAKDLANLKLIKHANIGVQAYACCAIADIIRLYAPDAPFSDEELSHIFKAFFAQFSHLWDEENSYFLQQSYILKRLVEVRSVVLIGDLPNSPQLLSLLFETMYNLTTKDFPSRLEPLASEMLAETISETDYVPKGVISLIIKHLTVAADSQLLSASPNISNTAFVFSLAICEANSDKMARLVAQLFSEMLDESARSSTDRDRRAPFKALEKIHHSSVQIWAHLPDLLGSVMGLINDELNSDDEGIRILATETIGRMLSSSSRSKIGNSAVTFVNLHRETWTNWLKKSFDSSSSVRAAWIEQAATIVALETTSEINLELSKGFSKCLTDSSEKVRHSACVGLDTLSFTVSMKKICNVSILKNLLQLIREKHPQTRNMAINILADLYNNCMASIVKEEVLDLGSLTLEDYKDILHLIVNGVPNHLLRLNYINDRAITTAVDISLFEKLLPFDDSAEVRVFRLCHFFKELEEKGKLAFIAIIKRQIKNADVLLKFLDLAEEYASNLPIELEDKENSHTKTESIRNMLTKMEKIARWLESQVPEGLNSFEAINTFFRLKSQRFNTLLRNCVSPDLDYKTVKNSAKELLTKLSDVKNLKHGKEKPRISTADMISNMKILLYRSSMILFNRSNISHLIKFSQDFDSDICTSADEIMSIITTNCPRVFENHIDAIVNMVYSDDTKNITVSLLQSLYHILKKAPEKYPDGESFFNRMFLLATKGNHLQAKYCSKILGCSSSRLKDLSRILDSILPLNPRDEYFATHLSVVAEVYLIEPYCLAPYSSEINTIVVEEVLKKNRIPLSRLLSIKHLKWIDEDQLCTHEVLIEKLMAVRLIANKLRYIATSDTIDNATLSAAEKPIKLLASIISNNGELVKSSRDAVLIATPHCYRLKLKLVSGLMLIKLAKLPRLNSLITLDVIKKMTRLLLDEDIQVRRNFLKSLRKSLQEQTISERFLHLVFFMGHEPDTNLKDDISTWIASQHRRLENSHDTIFEKTSVRLIYAIAHDERFNKLISDVINDHTEDEVEAYLYALKFVSMYIGIIARESNINLLYYLASRVKQYRDKLVDPSAYGLEDLPDEVMNLYRVAELFQLMLKELADHKSWNLQTWPGKINLPADLFLPMEDYQQAQEFVTRVYIPDLIQIELRKSLSNKSIKVVKKRVSSSQKRPSEKPTKRARQTKRRLSKIGVTRSQNKTKSDTMNSSGPSVIRKSARNVTKLFYGESDNDTQASDLENETSETSDFD